MRVAAGVLSVIGTYLRRRRGSAPEKIVSPISLTGEMGIHWMAFLEWRFEGSSPQLPR
jgi:hypothetical protein